MASRFNFSIHLPHLFKAGILFTRTTQFQPLQKGVEVLKPKSIFIVDKKIEGSILDLGQRELLTDTRTHTQRLKPHTEKFH